jgi:hypothetical protein
MASPEFRIESGPRPEPPQPDTVGDVPREARADVASPPRPSEAEMKAPAQVPALAPGAAPAARPPYKTKSLDKQHGQKEKEQYEQEKADTAEGEPMRQLFGDEPLAVRGPQMTWREVSDPKRLKSVKYITSEAERRAYELEIGQNGEFYWGGDVFEVERIAELRVVGGFDAAKTEGAIFVMTESGKIYMANQSKEIQGGPLHFHHSTFLAGEPVAAAGVLKFSEEKGKVVLKEVTDMSGHYKPDLEHTRQFLTELHNRGVNLKGVAVRGYLGTGKGDQSVDAELLIADEYAGLNVAQISKEESKVTESSYG